jgi:hypothetical protein
MGPNRQDILNGTYEASRQSLSSGPWKYHWGDDKGEFLRNPIPGYCKCRKRGRECGHGTRGMREGYGIGAFHGYHDAYNDVEMGGQAYERGFGQGMCSGGTAGYDRGSDDYDRYDGYGGGFDGGYSGHIGGYDGGYDGGSRGDYDAGYDGYAGEFHEYSEGGMHKGEYGLGYEGGFGRGYNGYTGGFGGYGFY